MLTSSFHKIPSESKAIAQEVKESIIKYVDDARIILFGSRARGDADEESDWDFPVLTHSEDTEELLARLRRLMREEVESKYNIAISLIVKNAIVWETSYAVTNIYESISEEGILL